LGGLLQRVAQVVVGLADEFRTRIWEVIFYCNILSFAPSRGGKPREFQELAAWGVALLLNFAMWRSAVSGF
jgi:hypothetical protein